MSLAEWLVLCLVCEQPRHGFAIARLVGAEGSMGQVWRVPKPVVYRALQRLEQFGLVRTAEQQASSQGPVRSLIDATPAGRDAARGWQTRPVSHTRDVRSELLVKLALLDRAGADPQPLLDAQREHLAPVADALRGRLDDAAGFDRTLILWRYETVSATIRFLDALRARASAR
jgi:DNA-binding PadR family transcriptional regulator